MDIRQIIELIISKKYFGIQMRQRFYQIYKILFNINSNFLHC